MIIPVNFEEKLRFGFGLLYFNGKCSYFNQLFKHHLLLYEQHSWLCCHYVYILPHGLWIKYFISFSLPWLFFTCPAPHQVSAIRESPFGYCVRTVTCWSLAVLKQPQPPGKGNWNCKGNWNISCASCSMVDLMVTVSMNHVLKKPPERAIFKTLALEKSFSWVKAGSPTSFS